MKGEKPRSQETKQPKSRLTRLEAGLVPGPFAFASSAPSGLQPSGSRMTSRRAAFPPKEQLLLFHATGGQTADDIFLTDQEHDRNWHAAQDGERRKAAP
jgi:hypothetical protein